MYGLEILQAWQFRALGLGVSAWPVRCETCGLTHYRANESKPPADSPASKVPVEHTLGAAPAQ